MFADAGWNIAGIDFTNDGLLHFQPELAANLEVGNVFETLEVSFKLGNRYDLIAINNVLEHVIGPVKLLEQLRQIMAPNGLLRISMPKDGAWLQQYAVELDVTDRDFWVAYPEHLNYFNNHGLLSILKHVGFSKIDLLADFEIDLFLLPPQTNYRQNKAMGSVAHDIRLKFETQLFRSVTMKEFINFRKASASVGVGRNLIAYVKI